MLAPIKILMYVSVAALVHTDDVTRVFPITQRKKKLVWLVRLVFWGAFSTVCI